MRRILLVHPEGNCNYNPNLWGIVEILLEGDYSVDVVSRERNYQQKVPRGANLITYSNNYFRQWIRKILVNLNLPNIVRKPLAKLFFGGIKTDKEYACVIGVDHYGIIKAAELAKIFRARLGMISYEIAFEGEAGQVFKLNEKRACSKLAFAVCQDEVRSQHLSIENSIPIDKIINIPVAGRSAVIRPRNYLFHEKFSLPKETKVALYMGSCAKWSCFEAMLQSVSSWHSDWVLVVNSRTKLEIAATNSKIFFIEDPAIDFTELSPLVLSADVGLAFYQPTYESIYHGKNLEYLGLASGKISTYLQHGLPVITNEIGLMSDHIRKYNLGAVVSNFEMLAGVLAEFEASKFKNSCYEYFNQKLSLDNRIDPLLRILKDQSSQS